MSWISGPKKVDRSRGERRRRVDERCVKRERERRMEPYRPPLLLPDPPHMAATHTHPLLQLFYSHIPLHTTSSSFPRKGQILYTLTHKKISNIVVAPNKKGSGDIFFSRFHHHRERGRPHTRSHRGVREVEWVLESAGGQSDWRGKERKRKGRRGYASSSWGPSPSCHTPRWKASLLNLWKNAADMNVIKRRW